MNKKGKSITSSTSTMKINLRKPNPEDADWRDKQKAEIANYINSIYVLKPEAGVRIIACDGAGPRIREERRYCGVGIVVFDYEDGEVVSAELGACYCDKEITTNLAESLAIWLAVQSAVSFPDDKKTIILTDCLVMYNAIVCADHIPKATEPIVAKIVKYLPKNASICWAPRELNIYADRVSKEYAEKITAAQNIVW